MKEESKGTSRDSFKLTPASRRLYNALINPENFDLNVTQICEVAQVDRNTYYRRMAEDEFVSKVKAEQKSQVESKIGNVLNATYKYALEERGHQDRKMLLTWAGEYTDKLESKIEGTVDIGSTADMISKYLKADNVNTEDSHNRKADSPETGGD